MCCQCYIRVRGPDFTPHSHAVASAKCDTSGISSWGDSVSLPQGIINLASVLSRSGETSTQPQSCVENAASGNSSPLSATSNPK
jgi:hypothetical protein